MSRADGTQLDVRRMPTASYGADWHFGNGQIWIRTYDQSTQTFGAEKMLVADASNNYYPSFSPDGKWVLFNKSDDNMAAGAYNNPSASVWVIAADGSAPAVKLATLDTAIGFTNSWARWAPFAQTVGTDETILLDHRVEPARLRGAARRPPPAADLDDRVRAVARDGRDGSEPADVPATVPEHRLEQSHRAVDRTDRRDAVTTRARRRA